MTSPRTLAATLRDEIAALFVPLVAAAQHPGGVAVLLRSLGHTDELAERPDLRAELERLATLAQQITGLPTDTLDSPEGIVQVLRLGGDLFGAVRGIEQLVQEPSVAEQAQGLGLDLVEQLTALHLRTRHPTLLRIANLLTLVTPAETALPHAMSMQGTKLVRLGWRGDRFHFDRIGALLDRPLPTLAEHYFPNGLAEASDAHESARRLFPLLHLAAQALSLSSFQDVVPVDPNAAAPSALAEVNDSDHFGLEHDDEPPLPDIPVPEAIDLRPYFEAHLPRFVTVLPGLVVDGVVVPARLALAMKVSSARHPGAARGLVVHPLGQLKLEESRAGWHLSIESDGQVPGWLFGPDGVGLAPTEATPAGASVRLLVEHESAPGTPAFVFGAAPGTRLEIGALQITIEARVVKSRGELSASIDAKSGAIVVASDDGFLSSLLPEGGLRTGFDLGLGWSSERGLTLRGSAGLDAVLPIGRSLGGLTLRSLRLRLQARNAEIAGEITANLLASIGPVSALVDGLGLEALISFPREGGNLGVAYLDFRFKPPSGVGLSVDARGVLTGGGFLFHDAAQGLYAGAMQLSLQEQITLKAFGLIATRMPDGSRGYSLIVFITAEDFRPIPLGLGFTLLGIGGMVGVNRTFDQDVLRQGLKNGTLATLLFPRDPVGNAPTLIRSLASAFPARRGSYLLGILAKIGWFTPTLVLMDLALILEFGSRERLLALGRISALLPSADNDLVRLNMEAMGVIDFDAGTAAIDAVLVDSRLAHKFPITGSAALRAGFGTGPSFVLSVGGFNPRFAAPATVPALERVAIALSSGNNPRLICEAYFAITSNTVQFGAHASLYAGAGGFSVEGAVGYDVLVQLFPLHFIAEFHAKLQLKRGSHNLFMVKLEGSLEGPRPLRVSGKATFEILWCDFSVRFDTTLVKGERPPLPPAVNVLAELTQALASPSSWSTQRSATQTHGVALRSLPPASPTAPIVLDPLGQVLVKQQVVPLNTARDIDTFGGAPVAGARRFGLTAALNGTPLSSVSQRAAFAPAQFFEMSDDEKLAAPSFESMDAGCVFGDAKAVFDPTQVIPAPLEYEPISITLEGAPATVTRTAAPAPYTLSATQLQAFTGSGAAARAPVRHVGRARFRNDSVEGAASFAPKRWTIMPNGEGPPATVDPAVDTWSEYQGALKALNRGGARWQIVPTHEIEG